MAKASEAARILSKRFQSRHRYRIKRDTKIAVDYLGREYKYEGRVYRLVAYNPNDHTIRLAGPFFKYKDEVWATDQFWRRLKLGTLVEDHSTWNAGR